MRFIRKNGRVIPINEKKDTSKGAAVGAAIGTTYGLKTMTKVDVNVAGKHLHNALKGAENHFNSMRGGSRAVKLPSVAKQAVKSGFKKTLKIARFKKAAPYVAFNALIGASVGSSLEYGINKLNNYKNNKSEKKEDFNHARDFSGASYAEKQLVKNQLKDPKKRAEFKKRFGGMPKFK